MCRHERRDAGTTKATLHAYALWELCWGSRRGFLTWSTSPGECWYCRICLLSTCNHLRRNEEASSNIYTYSWTRCLRRSGDPRRRRRGRPLCRTCCKPLDQPCYRTRSVKRSIVWAGDGRAQRRARCNRSSRTRYPGPIKATLDLRQLLLRHSEHFCALALYRLR